MGNRLGGELGTPQERRRLVTPIRGDLFTFENYYNYAEDGSLQKTGGMKMKLFGLWDYGYQTTEEIIGSTLTWLLVTWGSFSIDKLEAILILGIALYLQETYANTYYGNGSSWVHNVQAGYCWYHYFIRGRRNWPVFLGSMSELLSDFGAIALELKQGEFLYSHKAHWRGASEGMFAAFLFDMFRPKKSGKKHSVLIRSIPFIAIVTMGIRSYVTGETQQIRISDA